MTFKNKIVHVMSMDKFLPPYINFIKNNFILNRHEFVFIGTPDYKYGLDKNAPVSWVSGDEGLKSLTKQLLDSSKIIVHGLWSPEIQVILFKIPSLLSKCYWVMWGGDFYFPERQGDVKKWIIKNIGYLITIIDGDVDYVRKEYGSTGKHIRCFSYTSNLFRGYDLKSPRRGGVRILVGNSADPSNNHHAIFGELVKYKQKDIEIYSPLSYGDSSYAAEVVNIGINIFGEKFKPLLDFLNYEQYIHLISSMDIAIFSHDRQQALGNIVSLLGMGKKVYINNNSVLFEFFKKIGVTVFPTSAIDVEIIPSEIGSCNAKIIKKFFSKAKLIEQWKAIFEGQKIDSELSSAPRRPLQYPFFSVVMPVYNREAYLEEAMRSVLSQGFDDFELIISDDGSTDKSLQIAESFDDHRIRILRGPHGGGASARNRGLAAARGEFIVWIDSDDIQEPGALATLRKAIHDTPDADVFYGDLIAFDDGNPAKTVRTNYPDYFRQDILPNLLRGNVLPNPGTAVRKALYDRYGDYDVSFRRCHDYQIWTRLADSAKFKKVDAFLCRWRQHGGSLSSTTSKLFEGRVLMDMFERYPVSRLFPGLSDGDSGPAALRAADMLESLQEFGPAARMMCRAGLSGHGDTARLRTLMCKAGANFMPALTCVIRSRGDIEGLSTVLDDLENQIFQDFNVYIIASYDERIERKALRAWPVVETIFQADSDEGGACGLPVELLSGASIVWIDESMIYPDDYLKRISAGLEDGSRHVARIDYVQ